MNLFERAKMLQASSERVANLIANVNDKALNLTGGLGVSNEPATNVEITCADGTMGFYMETAYHTALYNEERLETLSRFLEETICGSTKSMPSGRAKSLVFTEAAADEPTPLPRFLKRTPDAAEVAAVARELGVERT